MEKLKLVILGMMYIKINKRKNMFSLKNSTKSLESILSGFTKTLEELNSFVSTKKEENQNIKQEIFQLQGTLNVNNMEVDKAESVIKNINNIIGK